MLWKKGELLGFPGVSDGKESACNVGDLGSIPGVGRSPGRRHGNTLWYSCLENPHGQRSLVGCSPWGCKESDTTERLPFTFHFHALDKEMTTHSSIVAGESQGRGSLVGCHLWGRTELDITEAT